MGKLYAIGEVLIDFVPLQKGLPLKDVISFEKAPGGAPANVAAAVAKYGGQSSMITKVGEDPFGDFLIEKLESSGVEIDRIRRTNEAKTGVAFVSLKEDGERDFSFYRHPSADLLLQEKEIDSKWFEQGDILHFCSVDLVESPMKQAHKKAINAVIDANGLVSFDPNVRLSLWDNPEACRSAIIEFIPHAHLVKISVEELEFITNKSKMDEAIQSIFIGNVKAVIYTKGAAGADLYIREYKYESIGYPVEVVDTTGAGDAFIGGVLYKLLEMRACPSTLEVILQENHAEILSFANGSGALTTTGRGAISSLPTKAAISELINV
ncbi:carbohydrate kinase [Cytobacillus solani]|uniref:carbohydrate kinase family protein n=1 Tax=Cytobacillus solani TaxID=1637975 RepID=UPI00207AA4F0|nr:carbohydrate kinase [Cytobacillus solani]USK57188.1 carbohydrate kinase [Cytobacillus solani]